jgi:hypothetical protein
MKLVQKLAAVTLIAASSFAAQATQIASVAGVTWDTNHKGFTSIDFISLGNFTQWYGTSAGTPTTGTNLDAVVTPGTLGSYLQGAGVINSFNGQNSGFVCASCQLTFTFGGLKFDGNVANDGSLFDIAASKNSAFFNLYSRATNNFTHSFQSETELQRATNGTLFLGMQLVNLVERAGFTPASGFIDSYYKATGGAAAWNFDTNTQLFKSDIWFTASASLQGGTFLSGNGTAIGDSISAPSSLAVLGLGLLGLAGVARRKKSA